MKRLTISLCAVCSLSLALSSIAVTSAGASKKAPIKIGALQDLTGPVSAFGLSIEQGIETEVAQVNASGGILGRKIDLITKDTASLPTNVNAAASALVSDGVSAIEGPTASQEVQAAASFAKAHKTVVLAPSSADAFPSGVLNSWIYRTAPIETPALFKGVVQKMLAVAPFTKLAIVYDNQNATSIGEETQLQSLASTLGYTVTTVQSVSETQTDLSGVVSAISQSGANAIWNAELVGQAAQLMEDARGAGITDTFYGGATFNIPLTYTLAGGFANSNGSITYTAFNLSSTNPTIVSFVKAYTAKYKAAPDVFAAEGYAGMQVLVAAIKKAGSSKPAAVENAIRLLSNIPVVTGHVNFRNHPDNTTPTYELVKVENGAFVPAS